jgi:hypothetical protein
MDGNAQTASASAYNNGDFICIVTYSGARLGILDPQGVQHLLPPSANNQELGVAILEALAHSRPLTDEGDDALYDYDAIQQRYAQWVRSLMAAYGYASQNALFEQMKSCHIRHRGGTITICPTHHDQLEGWSGDGISEADHVILSHDSQPAEIGKALRLAFSRCTG